MDTEIAALASTAAATMVTLLTTDAWTRVKEEISGLWRRFRPEHAATVAADLAAAHELAHVVSTLTSIQHSDNVTITQKADARDHSTVIQVAGDGRFG